MGFFSAIKKFFGNDDNAAPAQTSEKDNAAKQPAPLAPTPAAEAVATKPEAPAAQVSPAPEASAANLTHEAPAASEEARVEEKEQPAASTAPTPETGIPAQENTSTPKAAIPEKNAEPAAETTAAQEPAPVAKIIKEDLAQPAASTAEIAEQALVAEAAPAQEASALPEEDVTQPEAPAPRAEEYDFMAALSGMAAQPAAAVEEVHTADAQQDTALASEPEETSAAAATQEPAPASAPAAAPVEVCAPVEHAASAEKADASTMPRDAAPAQERASALKSADESAPAAPVSTPSLVPADTASAAQHPADADTASSATASLEDTASAADAAATAASSAASHDYASQSADTVVNESAPADQTVTAASPEEAAMTLRLREAEPRLSAWLGIVLEGVTGADDLLWNRLRFLLRSLDAPEAEVASFLDDFKSWLARMEYRWLEEFRSELQYRLALALELEDEEDERSRLFIKLTQGLARTREHFARRMDAIFSAHSALNDAFWEEMEELFIMADLGYEPALELVNRLKERARKAGVTDPQGVRDLLRTEVEELFRAPRRITAVNPPEVILMIGVNGVGKTTTIAKLAHRARMQGKKVLIAAADTFRAAAVEQLKVWADRVGADFHCKATGADPAAVAYEAMDMAVQGGYDVLFVDTAGRLQTKVNLMEELTKIRQVLGKKHEGAPHRSILVIDATTGQNALSQTKLFKEAAGVDELILTKLDGTAKGGVAIAVAMQYNVPITFVGLGEKLEDLRPFNGADFARALLGEKA